MFPGARIMKLETNYRSSPAILRSANRVFRGKPVGYRKTLRYGGTAASGPGKGPRPAIRRFTTPQGMLRWVVRRARDLQQREGIPVGQMAMLFRLNETRQWAESQLQDSGVEEEERPRTLTVHGSKGLEFPVVFLCDLEESVFPSYRRPRRNRRRSLAQRMRSFVVAEAGVPAGCNLEEETRLFYVGVTRAQKHLYLLSVARKPVRGVSRDLDRSRFLRLV
jgi:superfamily I DNA/RNA helicase